MATTEQLSAILLSLTSMGMSFPGTAGSPVMKSEVMKGLSTTECWQEGREGFLSKWIGMSTTGIWLTQCMAPREEVGGREGRGGERE